MVANNFQSSSTGLQVDELERRKRLVNEQAVGNFQGSLPGRQHGFLEKFAAEFDAETGSNSFTEDYLRWNVFNARSVAEARRKGEMVLTAEDFETAYGLPAPKGVKEMTVPNAQAWVEQSLKRQRREELMADSTILGNIGGLAGNMAGQFVDPASLAVNLALSLGTAGLGTAAFQASRVGATSFGRALSQVGARQAAARAAMNAGQVGAQQAGTIVAGEAAEGALGNLVLSPIVGKRERRAGMDYGAKEVAVDTVLGGVFGAALGGVGVGASNAFHKMRRTGAAPVTQNGTPVAHSIAQEPGVVREIARIAEEEADMSEPEALAVAQKPLLDKDNVQQALKGQREPIRLEPYESQAADVDGFVDLEPVPLDEGTTPVRTLDDEPVRDAADDGPMELDDTPVRDAADDGPMELDDTPVRDAADEEPERTRVVVDEEVEPFIDPNHRKHLDATTDEELRSSVERDFEVSKTVIETIDTLDTTKQLDLDVRESLAEHGEKFIDDAETTMMSLPEDRQADFLAEHVGHFIKAQSLVEGQNLEFLPTEQLRVLHAEHARNAKKMRTDYLNNHENGGTQSVVTLSAYIKHMGSRLAVDAELARRSGADLPPTLFDELLDTQARVEKLDAELSAAKRDANSGEIERLTGELDKAHGNVDRVLSGLVERLQKDSPLLFDPEMLGGDSPVVQSLQERFGRWGNDVTLAQFARATKDYTLRTMHQLNDFVVNTLSEGVPIQPANIDAAGSQLASRGGGNPMYQRYIDFLQAAEREHGGVAIDDFYTVQKQRVDQALADLETLGEARPEEAVIGKHASAIKELMEERYISPDDYSSAIMKSLSCLAEGGYE